MIMQQVELVFNNDLSELTHYIQEEKVLVDEKKVHDYTIVNLFSVYFKWAIHDKSSVCIFHKKACLIAFSKFGSTSLA
jgi:hypothetical protein